MHVHVNFDAIMRGMIQLLHVQSLEGKPDDKVLDELVQLTGFGLPDMDQQYMRFVQGLHDQLRELRPGCACTPSTLARYVCTHDVTSGLGQIYTEVRRAVMLARDRKRRHDWPGLDPACV